MSDKNSYASFSIGFMDVMAAIISYYIHKSILWAVVHAVIGPVYVVYSIFKYPEKLIEIINIVKGLL